MPHLTLEYSSVLDSRCDMSAVARAAYDALRQTGIFPLAGIRVRLHRADFAIVADDHPDNSFLAMKLSVGAGRSTDALQTAGAAVFDAVRENLAEVLSTPHFALSLEIREINPDLSWKDTPIHARLTKRTDA